MATSKGGYVDGGSDLLKAPDAPTITSVTNGIGTMSVAFTAPANPGGSAVTGYTVTAINESTGASVGATGSASPISISPGSGTFKVRAAAANVYGPGRVSAFDTGNVVYAGAELYAWGLNSGGQLGDGTRINHSSPVQIGALTDWAQVAAGQNFTASIKTDGTLWTWGDNTPDGQLGDGTRIDRSSPVQIGALTNWAQVSAGASHAASIKTDGTLWTWGLNSTGQLGQNTVFSRSSPVQVGALTDWAQVSAFGVSAASIKTDGTLWAWGTNGGILGDGTAINRSSPVQIGALTNWSYVAGGRNHIAAVKTDGTLWAWGINTRGQLGQGNVVARSSPVQVGALTNWSHVAAGYYHTASIKADSTLWSWGYNTSGQLGDGTIINRSSPVQVGGLTDWAHLSAGGYNTTSVKTDGTLWAWGANTQGGQLGDDTVVNKSSPIQVGALTNWAKVASGRFHTAALYGVT